MAKIELQHVSFSYPGTEAKAIDDLSLKVHEGELVCVVGCSGCGKTTLLRLLAGLSTPTRGVIRINGQPVKGPGRDRTVVFQEYTLFPWMTALRNIQFGIEQTGRWGKLQAKQRARAFLKRVGLETAASQYPHQLSGGMRQRVSIARSLAMDTDILLLDEPFSALDAKSRSNLQLFLESIRLDDTARDRTMIFVTHSMNEALFLADRIVYMAEGRITAEFPIELPRPRSTLTPDESERLGTMRRELFRLFDQEEDPACWPTGNVS